MMVDLDPRVLEQQLVPSQIDEVVPVRPVHWRERVAGLAVKAANDIEELLEYQPGPDGTPVSKLSEGERGRYNRFLMQIHPENAQKENGITVKLDMGDLIRAASAAREVDARKTITVTAQKVIE